MDINIQISRRHAYMILFVLVLGFASVLVFSQSSPTQGHPASEITPGTFNGAGDYIFPPGSKVGIGKTDDIAQLTLFGDSGNAGEILLQNTEVGSSIGILFDVVKDPSRFAIKTMDNRLNFYTDDRTASGFKRRMTILPDGKVGIGTDNPQEYLHIAEDGEIMLEHGSTGIHFIAPFDTATGVDPDDFSILNHNNNLYFRSDTGSGWDHKMVLASDGKVGIGTITPSTELEVKGDVTAGAFFYSSDASLKTNIQDLPNSLEKINQLRGVSFEWKENNRESIGLIAQEAERVFPEIVSTDENTGLKSISYANLVAPLIEAVKEQQKQIDELEKEIEELKKE